MDSKFTPGPWVAKGTDIFTGYPVGRSQEPEEIIYAMQLYEVEGTQEANARLIAAAPDMYEALKAIIESGEIPLCYSDKLVVMAKQALAKAEGRGE